MYVSNKTKAIEHLFLSLRTVKLGDAQIYSQLNRKIVAATQEGRLVSTLTQAGFIELLPGIPVAFQVVRDRKHPVYVSLHDGNNLLTTDMPVSPSEYGCLSITGEPGGVCIRPSNPKPVWLPCSHGDPLPEGAIRCVELTRDDSCARYCLARSEGKFSHVDFLEDGSCNLWLFECDADDILYNVRISGDILKDTGYDLVPAKRGDPLPPNSLQLNEDVYIGRLLGDYLCPIYTRKGKVQHFLSLFREIILPGEIMVHTSDPHYS